MTKTEIAQNYIRKYLDLAQKYNTSYSKTFIAQNMQAENPDMFANVENARSTIRYALNLRGVKLSRKKNETLAEKFALIEQPVREINFKPFIVPKVYNKTLIINDVHLPFEDRKALFTAIEYGIKRGCDSVIINGDFVDFYVQSDFDKNPKIVGKLINQRDKIQSVLEILQHEFGYVVYKYGNHEKRLTKYLNKESERIPELEDFLTIDDYMRFDGCSVNFVEDYNPIKFGKLNIIHGHEMYGGGGIHLAYNRLRKTMDNVVSAHSHRTDTRIETSTLGIILGSWAVGCLCNLHPQYNPMNNWNHGLAYIEKDGDGDFVVDNKRIINGKVF
jgi:hypothetical protein